MSEPITAQAAPPVFGLGDRGRAVSEIRARLDLLGLTADGDGGRHADPETFDERLDQAVRAFQQQRGLAADGIVGPLTWPKLVVQVQNGSTGDAVRGVQEVIKFHDQSDGEGTPIQIDGIFGPRTEAWVRGFQTAVGTASDGIVGPITWRAMVSGMLSG